MNETAQKILGYIKRLPETWDGQPLRQQALDNFDEDCVENLVCNTDIDFIAGAFDWDKTSQSWDYWNKIDGLILNGTIQLLPEEKKEDLSDTSTWSDETKHEFYKFCMNKKGTGCYLNEAIEEFVTSKQRKPLFVTEDGVRVFEFGAELVCVEKDFNIRKTYISPFASPLNCNKYFSTEAAASEYVRLNKPMYSLNDVSIALKIRGFDGFVAHRLIAQLEKLKP